MPYEPVGYIIEYEISALAFLIVIMTRYFGARRFPNQKNQLFSLILWITFADLVLDIVSSLIIDNVFLVPIAITFFINEAFYFLQILLPLLMTVYTLAMVDYLSWRRAKRLLALLLPGALILFTLLSNPITHWFFYVDPLQGYVHGTMFIYTYGACLFYMIVTFVTAYCNKARLRKSEYTSIFRFLIIVLVSMLIQFFYPAVLLTGVAIALSVVLMYFTIQNPETMLDTTTGAFTYEAMLVFLHDRVQSKDRIQLVAVKIKNLSRINELLGMGNGSLLLRQVRRFLQESVKDAWVFRMRGSSFVVITRNRGDYSAWSAQLSERIKEPWVVGNTEVLLQATVCCVAADELMTDSVSPEETVAYLDTAFLQDERTESRVRTVTVGAELMARFRRSRLVESALRTAIESGDGLELYFQPLWSVRQARFVSAEVLLRFHHPEMGFISPDEFVPIAEGCGLVTAMDELVVRKACAFIRDNAYCRSLGLESLDINLSALEFMHIRLPELINGIMEQFQVDPSFLCFEITETAATESFELLKECMLHLSQTGCRFALDDFGTGYANISQVIQLPFSIVKLDRSLLLGSELVLEDMARMFSRMNCQTVVEGVETAEQAALTKSIQVDYVQGFYYARPMNQTDFIRFLHDHAEPHALI